MEGGDVKLRGSVIRTVGGKFRARSSQKLRGFTVTFSLVCLLCLRRRAPR
jgi:hypothetical protein